MEKEVSLFTFVTADTYVQEIWAQRYSFYLEDCSIWGIGSSHPDHGRCRECCSDNKGTCDDSCGVSAAVTLSYACAAGAGACAGSGIAFPLTVGCCAGAGSVAGFLVERFCKWGCRTDFNTCKGGC